MPDEFEFKKYTTLEEFGKSAEATKYLHDLYLKAVNHPIRRKILTIINDARKIEKYTLLKILTEKEIVKDEFSFNYNMDYLIKAFCVKKVEEKGEIYYEITQSGQVVDHLK